MDFPTDNGEGAVLCEDQPKRVIARDIQLIARARREGWLKDPADMQRIADRVVKIALTTNDDELAIKAAAEVRQMVAQDLKIEADGIPQQVEHHHTHELGPITADNIAQQRAARLARFGASS